MVLVTGSCRQRGVASGQAKVTNHRVQQLCDTNFHLHSVLLCDYYATAHHHTSAPGLEQKAEDKKVSDKVRITEFQQKQLPS